jgi:hypothetical protein
MRNSPKALSNIANNLNFQAQQQAPQEFELPPQAIAIVNVLFNDLKGICTAWRQTFTDVSIEQAAKQQWAQAFVENNIVNQSQIDFGMKKARQLAKPWFPSSGEFISWCKPSLEDYGLPNAEQALRKVINGQKRSHPVFYATAVATGSRELKTMPHTDLLKLFTRNYEIICQNYINGDDFSQVIPKALPEKVYVVADMEKRLSHTARLREILRKGAA